MKHFSFAILLFATVACNKGDSGGGTPPAASSPVKAPVPVQAETEKIEEKKLGTGVIGDEDVVVEVTRKVNFDVENGIRGTLSNLNEFKAELNKRKIKVVLKRQDYINNHLRLECGVEGAEDKITGTFKNLVAEIPEFNIDITKELNPILNCSIQEGGSKKYEKRSRLFKDLYVSKNMAYAELGLIPNQQNEIDTLIFNDKAVLTTDGTKLYLKAKLIIADESTIQTLPKGAKAKVNKKGRSGGYLKIDADVAVGELDVIMRGETAGANDAVDKTDYTSPKTIQNLFEAQLNPVCANGATIPTEIRPKDMTGFQGGDSGQFYMKADDSMIDVNIISLPGAGGEGGYSFLKSKETVIPAEFVVKTRKYFMKKVGWAYELMDKYMPKRNFYACRLVKRTCGSTQPGVKEVEPRMNHPKVWDRCKVGIPQEHLGTNFYFDTVTLNINLGLTSKPTRGMSGPEGVSCRPRITDNVYECL